MGKRKEHNSSPLRLAPPPISTQLSDPAFQNNSVPVASELDSPLPEALLQDAANVLDDGRISVNLNTKLAQVFAKIIEASEDEEPAFQPPPAYSTVLGLGDWQLPLNIVIQVVGSRGDVQPFVALGTELQRYGHRVRLATHDVFRDFVQTAGLEFYSIGGNPAELMAYMVKNPGLLPRIRTLREGEIGKQRQMIREILNGCWASCLLPDPETEEPFVAHAIIANPPSFAHVHCAQALGIPLHIMFTMPWTPTRAFPHPLANVNNTNTDKRLANYISYGMVQLLTWNGMRDVVQEWRKAIDLEEVPLSEAPFLMETLKIPHTYCWSPALVPKPRDWGNHIDVCGFLFREHPSYTPQEDLDAFLKAGPPPIYIGFGSIVIPESEKLTRMLLDAVKACGTRAIISKGWSNLESIEIDENIFFLGDCPHEWLFQQVSAVVHHGGAGTTACGLFNARPTVVVPFFGDQQFWGAMVATARAGPKPIPFKQLTAENLAQAIKYCLNEDARQAALAVAEKMRIENGVKAAVESFHRHLPVKDMGCDLIPGLPATWVYTRLKKPVKMSGAAAEILVQGHRIKAEYLQLYRSKPIIIENRRWDFVTGILSGSLEFSYDVLAAFGGFYSNPRAILKNKERQRAQARASSQHAASQRPSEEDPGEGSSKDIVRLVGASAMSIPKLPGTFFKGLMVDVPVAMTEGFRNTPKLWGEKVPDHAPVTDWKSGVAVASTTFVHQLAGGLTDFLVQPVKGARREGAVGFGKGVGKGALQTFTKSGAAFSGLIGYTGQGIYKSLHTATHSKTKKSVASARRVQDKYFIRANGACIDTAQILEDFDKIHQRGAGSETASLPGSSTASTLTRFTSVFSSSASIPELPQPSASTPLSPARAELGGTPIYREEPDSQPVTARPQR